MERETIKQIEMLTRQLGELVVSLEPQNSQEWNAHDKVTAAHKQMRSIDIMTLAESEPRAPMTR